MSSQPVLDVSEVFAYNGALVLPYGVGEECGYLNAVFFGAVDNYSVVRTEHTQSRAL